MKNSEKDSGSTSAELEVGHASDLKEGNIQPIDPSRSAADLAVNSAANFQAENIQGSRIRY